ncbi:LuxR family transcriptional regulator [Bifidobacterium avesanii]|uniref:Response regulator n=1 Tax=Bifidobacterium avesanii TaxID=1798157 RepID=A0A7K3THJ9_9BIFI|nr:LuxR family transcriptional regulator [Bifidobacterium avesanii]NEG77723.1 response regulator [Bifidobacterium avesanii]
MAARQRGVTGNITEGTGHHSRSGTPLRLGIVDNDPLVLRMLERNINGSGAPVEVAWTASSAVDALSRRTPDMVLTDLQMPGVDGAELARRMHAASPGIPVVGITAFAIEQPTRAEHDDSSPFAAVLDKIIPTPDLLAELARISGNASMLAWLAGESAAKPLSDQELEVMRLYTDGLTNEAIAHRMHVGLTTVKTYARRAFEKLGTHSRTEAVIACLRRGLI